jgi:hypothetical protein
MFNPKPSDYCSFDIIEKIKLIVVVDTEEEFDWSYGFSRKNISIKSIRWISRVQNIFDQYGIIPVYVIDYPVASQPDGFQKLQEIHQDGRCLIGAHLHPWVNPPFEELINSQNSFPGNLPHALESTKLQILGECIQEKFGIHPSIYKAGRYGIGPHTAEILESQGYEVDMSVCPYADFSTEGGPDFTYLSAWPYWFGKRRRLLELPRTVGYVGVLRRWGAKVHGIASRLHGLDVLARLRLVERTSLSPEGCLSSNHIKLVRALHHDGLRIYSFTFHSPSVEPGHTPYVTSQSDLEEFLNRCRRFFDFFMGELGGEPSTPLELKDYLSGACNNSV